MTRWASRAHLPQVVATPARSVRNRLVGHIDAADPSLRLALSASRSVVPELHLVCVYRRRNAAVVTELLAQHPGVCARLWALDDVAPELAHVTVGSGPGRRFALVNRLIGQSPLRPGSWLVVADDDVTMTKGTLGQAAAVAGSLGLNLVQPAHDRRSHASWPVTRRRPLTVARACAWVEIGPVVLLDDAARGALLPFPESGMGWGTEVDWAAHHGVALHNGIIDCVHMRHLERPGTAYDSASERTRLEERLVAHGLDIADGTARLQAVGQTWRPGRRGRAPAPARGRPG